MANNKRRMLILEDDEGLRRQYRWALSEHELLLASTRDEALAMARATPPAVAIVDLGLPPDPDGASEGLAALEALRLLSPDTKVIIATGNENREHALRSIALGAYDFFQKPVDIDLLRLIVERAFRLYELETENRSLAEAAPRSPIDGVLGTSDLMLRLLRVVEKIAPTDVAVLLLGESGTGKELLAQAIHRLSARAKGPFVAINCAAIPETLLESELFGHEKGAFTGAVRQTIGKIEKADKGTLFLDEIGDLPLAMQVKVLRFLQDHVVERIGGRQQIHVDVRIVCATNQDLDKLIADSRFREDLYYRLNELKLNIPPLRERNGDALLLASYFLKKFNDQYGRSLKGFTAESIAAIRQHPWRGNVRELENRMKRAVVMAEGPLVTGPDMDLASSEAAELSLDLRSARSRAEREVLQLALTQSGGNLSTAAKLLGISRPTLYSLAKEHGLAIES
ncbi:MAG TPA: PEP-CTERM-box response regulator transcription factor [Stellaceae bacterium]|nr:PEP-CTERM-box response regulator transcription factor [Stellaceae bacterium]